MTNPVFTTLKCAACGQPMGKKPGIVVIPDLLCTDPICDSEGAPDMNEQRDAMIVALALDSTPIVEIAGVYGMSRQRVYQIIDAWKQGV